MSGRALVVCPRCRESGETGLAIVAGSTEVLIPFSARQIAPGEGARRCPPARYTKVPEKRCGGSGHRNSPPTGGKAGVPKSRTTGERVADRRASPDVDEAELQLRVLDRELPAVVAERQRRNNGAADH